MAFTQAEMAVLAQLAYRDIPYDSAQRVTLAEFLQKQKEYLYEELGPNFKEIIDNLIKKVEGKDYVIVRAENDRDGTGFAAFAVKDPNNEVTVACRGTQGFSMDYDSRKDVGTDIQLGLTVEADQHKKMEEFMRKLQEDGYEGYYFVGHSLGGNLAMHGAIILNDSNKVLGVVTFNAPGFNEAYLRINAFKISKVENHIENFQNEYDYVSSIFTPPGQVLIIESSFTEGHLGFDDHNIRYFKIDKDGKFHKNKSGKKKLQTKIPKKLTEKIDSGWKKSLFYTFVFSRFCKSDNICRDFSTDAKQIFVDAARETEEEKWWQVTQWDCWYKIEKAFGHMDWQLCAGKVDEYYRKLIDINDASVKDIEKIFEQVYEIDIKYSEVLGKSTETLKSKVLKELTVIKDSIVIN